MKPCVLGHVRLARIPSKADAVWIESVVLHPDLRGKGFGKYLMLHIEKFAREDKGFSNAYLCTIDRQIFYSRCGYSFCDPVCAYSGNIKLPSGLTASNPQLGCETILLKQDSSNARKSKFSSIITTCDDKEKNHSTCLSGNLSSEIKKDCPTTKDDSNCDIKPTATKTKLLEIDDVTDISVLCARLYCRPSFPTKPPEVLKFPLRTLDQKNNSNANKVRKDEICRAVIPKDYMKKKL